MRTLPERYLSTYTGKKFFPFDPRPEQICIEDIAHGLSMLCRFSGQCPYFYSVAEHSIYLVHFLPDNLQLEGLLHDASEAYLADLPRPVKAGLPEYKAIEARVERVIAEKLGLPFPMAPEVKAADQALLKHEVFSFFGAERYFEDFGEEYTGAGVALGGMSPGYAEGRFLDLYASWALAMSRRGPGDGECTVAEYAELEIWCRAKILAALDSVAG